MVNFTIEAWMYLAIDIVVVFGRLLARWRSNSLRGLAVDDYLMAIAIIFYTAETATAHYVTAWWLGMANSGMTDDQRATIDPSSLEWHLREQGSKTQLFGWLIYTCLLWTLKTCWLFFYKRLGDGVDNMTLKINLGFIFVGTTFIATFFGILCGCWPIQKHWQINPDPGNFCQPAVSKLQAWLLICTNLTTDFYIMTIPLPMVWNARISTLKKCALGVMFCGAIITAVFGGLRCGFVLQDSEEGPKLAGEWSCRESFVAVFISNVPIVVPMLRRYYVRARGPTGSKGSSGTPGRLNSSGKGPFKLSTISSEGKKKKKFHHPLSLPAETFYERYGSEEEIIGNQTQTRDKQGHATDYEHERSRGMKKDEDITVTREWRVRSQGMTPDERERELRMAVNGFHAK